ncbi:MAG TPA: hypothetical protein VM219_06870 [Phycisphaerae bacterium]|nr:hypothetical protein [Phycisphaerae bacterium]
MARKAEGKDPSDKPEGTEGCGELVPVAHAETSAEAKLIQAELQAHGISAVVERERTAAGPDPVEVGAGLPVLVPEEFADEAAELIAELESTQLEGNALNEDDNLLENEDDEDEDWDEDEEDEDEEEKDEE